MAGYVSKEEERKALDKIRKIVSDLGPGSYLEATFRGCFDLAESNIDNDFMISFKDSNDHISADRDRLAKDLADAKEVVIEYQERLSCAQRELEDARKSFEDYRKSTRLSKEAFTTIQRLISTRMIESDSEVSKIVEDFRNGCLQNSELESSYRKIKELSILNAELDSVLEELANLV